ncbi:ATP-binding protein [Nocardia bovistercoris]|uniref:ATP-binding protein n=1 Tax=Nocardia bovistercoris TaxID=2785916 RepID=A0A931ICG0_9NOCA|nr:ATP-binding protein [Nocardia bovistercoris]
MTSGFVGRNVELGLLRTRLQRVTASGTAVAVAIRGRRQVGKSRLVQEFCDTAEVPYLYFTAIKGMPVSESLGEFLAELTRSGIVPDPATLPESIGGWPDAFRLLAASVGDSPIIVVIDELPWLAEQDAVFDGALQTAWDRLLRQRPILLLLLGSDIHMMERLTAYDRPFYGRADNLVLTTLNPAEVGSALGLDAAESIDAHLITGGLPGILRSWPHGLPPLQFVRRECADPAAPLFGLPESTLLAEFPAPDQARRVLEAIGSGERTHATIAATAGSRSGTLPSGTLSPLLHRLSADKHVLSVDHPLSIKSGKPALYRVADSNLRLYLAALRSMQDLVRRGRVDAAYDLFVKRWTSWRGKAVEPLIRDALELAALTGRLPWQDVTAVGGWWNRAFDPEIDLIGADRSPIAGRVIFAGSIKWLNTPFDRHDLAELTRAVTSVPGFTPRETALLVVSSTDVEHSIADAVDLVWNATDVLSAWS